MDDEEKKLKYKNIVNRLRVIYRKVDELSGDVIELENITKKSIVIDNQPLNSSEIVDIKDDIINVSKSIRCSIIPSLNKKTYN